MYKVMFFDRRYDIWDWCRVTFRTYEEAEEWMHMHGIDRYRIYNADDARVRECSV